MTTMGYKLTFDTGFAPNPFGGVLTLATCKPKIRRCRVEGDWLAGFASKDLVSKAAKLGVCVPYMGLIYLARVNEVLTLDDYWRDRRFTHKRPPTNPARATQVQRAGDNIYALGKSGRYEQAPNYHHREGEIARDLSGRNVLVCREFFYLGERSAIPAPGWDRFLGTTLSEARTFECPEGFAGHTRSWLLDHLVDFPDHFRAEIVAEEVINEVAALAGLDPKRTECFEVVALGDHALDDLEAVFVDWDRRVPSSELGQDEPALRIHDDVLTADFGGPSPSPPPPSPPSSPRRQGVAAS